MAIKRSQGSLLESKSSSRSQISESGSALSSENMTMLFDAANTSESGFIDDEAEDQFVDIEEDAEPISPSRSPNRDTSSRGSSSKDMPSRLSFECHPSAIFEAFNEELKSEEDDTEGEESDHGLRTVGTFNTQVMPPRRMNSTLSLVSLASLCEDNALEASDSIVHKVDRYIVNREIKKGSTIVRSRTELALRSPINGQTRSHRSYRRGSTNDSIDIECTKNSRMRISASTNDIASNQYKS